MAAGFTALLGTNVAHAELAPTTPSTPDAAGPFYVPPTFNAVPSNLTASAPTDISMGWDGTLWAIDTNGEPHQYDHIGQTWGSFGSGIDAAADVLGYNYIFRGDSFVVFNSILGAIPPPQTIASKWPTLPDSFKLGVDGAANFDRQLVLFKGGRFVGVNGSIPLTTLTSLPNWPQTPLWKDGVIDSVFSAGVPLDDAITLIRGNECIRINPQAPFAVVQPPTPLSADAVFGQSLPADWLASGFDGGYAEGTLFTFVFKGTHVIRFQNGNPPSAPQYIPSVFTNNWPATWHPVLAHAPSGQVENLWCLHGNQILRHDGKAWATVPWNDGSPVQALGVSTGVNPANDAAFMISLDGRLWQYGPNAAPGNTWTLAGLPGSTLLTQVSVGDAGHVWVRDAANQVHRYTGSQTFSPANLGSPATHIKANADGTLWHCDGVAPHAYRFISESPAPSTPVPVQAGVSAVQKVASTGFGTAFCLAASAAAGAQMGQSLQAAADTPQVYQYDSPYVFKTAKEYRPDGFPNTYVASLAVGPACVFVISNDISPTTAGIFVAALDAQTGNELWRQDFTDVGAPLGVVYDATHQLVYVNTPYNLQALDATTGAFSWQYSPGALHDASVFGVPMLSGASLYMGDDKGQVHLINTDAALQGWQQTQSPPTPVWVSASMTDQGGRCGRPSVDMPSGTLFIAFQTLFGASTTVGAVDMASGSVKWQQSQNFSGISFSTPMDCVVGQCIFNTNTGAEPALLVNAGAIWALRLADAAQGASATTKSLMAPTASGETTQFTSSMTMVGNTLYIGASNGQLYLIDTLTLAVQSQTQDTPPRSVVQSQPIVITDSQGNTAVYFVRLNYSSGLWLYDLTSGNVIPLGLDLNSIVSIAYDANHGVLYGAGAGADKDHQWIGQIFGIRAAQFIQDERAFIIESQLMQDFDEPAAGQSDPPSNARYQTHVALVDSNKAPITGVSVKIWPDAVTTLSIDGGAPVTVYPNNADPNQQYVAFQSDGTGSFTITSGSHLADGSDAADLTAVTLRIWAGFMDAHERMIVNPDAEFHSRVASAHATVQNAGSDDPAQLNLQNTQDYQGGIQELGNPLFTDGEKTSGTPGQAATAIQNTTRAVGISSNASPAHIRAAWLRKTGDAPGRYTPDGYTLPGQVYQATNTPADRSITPSTTLGFSFVNGVHTPLLHSDAASQIDALGEADLSTMRIQGMLTTLGFFSSLKDAWKDIKQVGAVVTHAIVSAAKEVYVGIRYVVNGVVNVVKAVAQDIEDAMVAVGSFFVQLGKDILKVIQAISAFFHFGSILTTYHIIRAAYTDMTNQLEGYLTAAKTDVDNAFDNLETKIDAAFEQLIQDVDGASAASALSPTTSRAAPKSTSGTPINGLSNMGSTPTSVLTITPPGSTQSQSQAVQGLWGTNKFRQNSDQASLSNSLTAGANPIADFAASFYARLQDDNDLKSSVDQAQQQFKSSFQFTSASNLLGHALGDVLEVLKLAAVSSVAVAGAFVDGILGLAADLGSALQTAGIIQIPILSALWSKLQKAFPALGLPNLDLIDLMAFIAAIPATYLYRAIDGNWPTNSSVGTADASPAGTQRTTLTTTAKVLGIAKPIISLVVGVLTGVNDFKIATTAGGLPATTLVKAINVTRLLGMSGLNSFEAWQASQDPKQVWKGMMDLLNVGNNINNLLLMFTLPVEARNYTSIAIGAALSLVNYVFMGLNQNSGSGAPEAPAALAARVLGQLPASTRPVLFVPLTFYGLPLIQPVLDIAFGCGQAIAQLVNIITVWNTPPSDEPPPARLYKWYFPWIANDSARGNSNGPAGIQVLPAPSGFGRLRALLG